MPDTSDVEMKAAEEIHPLCVKLEETEELITGLTKKSSPDHAIRSLHEIISHGIIVISCNVHADNYQSC